MNTMTSRTRLANLRAVLIGGLALPLAGFAQDQVDLGEYANNSYLSIKGTVEAVSPDAFVLSYNDSGDQVTVEMDDGDRDADAYRLLPGDEVTVYGVMDKDLFEMRKIEASSVYVEKLNTFFQASAVDEEDFYVPLLTIVATPADASSSNTTGTTGAASGSGTASPEPLLWLQGEVSDVQEDSFSLAMGDREISVTVEGLSENPLDDEGYRKIENGDVVSVLGNIDGDFFDSAELRADSVVKVHDEENI